MLQKTTVLSAILLFLWIPLIAHSPSDSSALIYVAHRGASYLAPQNTKASLLLAWELGADAAECDIRLTSDNRVIIFHDKNTKKLTGENYKIANTTWAQLKNLEIRLQESNRKSYIGEGIPLLKDVLPHIPENRMLVIEIKTGPEILPFLKNVVDQHWKSGHISFIAFDFETIRQCKALYPEVPCYYLSMFACDARKKIEPSISAGLDGLDLRHGIVSKKLAKRCRDAGLDLWCWTVNDPDTALKMHSMGVSALTTDRPVWLKQQMNELFLDKERHIHPE